VQERDSQPLVSHVSLESFVSLSNHYQEFGEASEQRHHSKKRFLASSISFRFPTFLSRVSLSRLAQTCYFCSQSQGNVLGSQ